MGSQFSWVFDLAVIAIVLFLVIKCARTGFKKNFSVVISYLLAIVIASLGSVFLAEPVYINTLRQTNMTKLEEAISEYDAPSEILACLSEQHFGAEFSLAQMDAIFSPAYDGFDTELYTYVNKTSGYTVMSMLEFRDLLQENFATTFGKKLTTVLPGYTGTVVASQVTDSDALYCETMLMLYGMDSRPEMAAYVEDTYFKEENIEMITYFLFLVLFFLVMSISLAVARRLAHETSFDWFPNANHLAGMVLGVVAGLICLAIVCVVVRFCMIIFTGDNVLLSEETIENTKLFRYLFQINWIVG